jgi:hypothetical protein
MSTRRILFSGYAPVHFLCFLPVYQELRRDGRVELWLSGGFKREQGEEVGYQLDGFYDPFPVDRARLMPVEQVRQEDFDVLVCAHLSDALFPRSAGRTVQIFHGVSFKNLAVREKALRFDYLCLPGRYHAELYKKGGLVRAGGSRYLMTGFPKADALRADVDARATLLRGLHLDPHLPTLLFAPTGDKHNALEIMGEELVQRIAADGRFNLLIKPHDHPKNAINWFERLAPLEGGRVRLVRDLDVVPLLCAADVLLTDASSVAVEYTLLDRPIVFLDVPRLLDHVRKRAPNLDLDTYGRRIGRVATSARQAISVIESALSDPDCEGELRRAMSRHVFYDPGRAVERVSGVVLHAAGLASALPAGVEEIEPDPLFESVGQSARSGAAATETVGAA